MLFFKYCPQCGSMQIKSNGSSLQECMKCHYHGQMKEGPMDQINAFAFNLRNANRSETLMMQSKVDDQEIRIRHNKGNGKDRGKAVLTGLIQKRCNLFLVFYLVSLFSIVIVGCAQLRPYVSSERGSLDMRVKQPLWEGQETKRYYITEAEEIINLGDNKKRLVSIMGYPDDSVLSLEGYEIWAYKDRKIKFYFDGDYIKVIKAID